MSASGTKVIQPPAANPPVSSPAPRSSAAAPPAPTPVSQSPKAPTAGSPVKTPIANSVAADVVDLAAEDEAPIPFDSVDTPVAPPPPSSTPSTLTSSSESPAEDASVDKDAFYDEPGASENRPVLKEPSRAVIYIDNKHRCSNDEGLILVVCGICGTRALFDASKGETTQQCPDCYTKYRLPKLPPGPVKKPEATPQDDLDEFKLEETFERQGYQPLNRDSVAAELVKGPPPQPPGVFGVPSAAAPLQPGAVVAPPLPPSFGASVSATTSSFPSGGSPSSEFGGTTAAAAAPSMIDPENRLPRPPNWAILVDVFNFVFMPLHLLAWISFTIIAMIPIAAAVIAMSTFPYNITRILILGCIPPLELAPFVFVASYFVHVVHDSSYGESEIKNWNAVNLVDNAIMAIYVFCAIFFAGLPGFLLSLPFSGSESNVQFLMILGSAVLLFPFCLLSLLEEESYWQTYNHEVFLSFRRSKDQVFLFFCGLFIFTIVTAALMFGIGSIAGIGGSDEEGSSAATTNIVLAFMVFVGIYWVITYGRMIGRLAWVMNYEAQHGPIDNDD